MKMGRRGFSLVSAVALAFGGCASGSSAPLFTSPVAQVCVGTCPLPPLVPVSECLDPSPQYLVDGAPTYCTYGIALNRVGDSMKACAKDPGIVQVTYLFDQQGAPRSIRADAACERCKPPRAPAQDEVLRCVERAAAAARLPLGPNRREFAVAFPYRVGEPEDPRLSPGYAPADGLLQ